ncbi:hypothetical protein [Anaerosinus massiliensis]|uniref:hypothetical protein n=1 Tax=Massilibacillus massiliensis TaxID=1806837 RepID=UPI0018FEF9F5|nr:hypothetical protein [Massilibacillus massiliensis]
MIDEKWLFEDGKNVMVMTTKNIIKNHTAIVYVSHDEEDGMWQFHDGLDVDMNDAMLVSLEEIITLDSELMKLYDLPIGWIAWRDNKDSVWNRQPENS